MITIIRGRDSGKAKELLTSARENKAAILTQDKHTFKVKAHSYGFDDITIIDYDDLLHDNYDLNTPIMLHNGDKVLYWLLDRFFGLTTIGFTATECEEK